MWKGLVIIFLPVIVIASNVCQWQDFAQELRLCHSTDIDGLTDNIPNRIYIMYDINSVEGFNLRRDVYIRLAVFVHYARKHCPTFKNAKLVLPPFHRLYHWKTAATDSTPIFWNHFFDLESLQKYTAVLDIWQYFQETTTPQTIDQLLQLGNYQNMFEDGRFIEKFEVTSGGGTGEPRTYYGYPNITILEKSGVRFQGSAMQLEHLLMQLYRKPR